MFEIGVVKQRMQLTNNIAAYSAHIELTKNTQWEIFDHVSDLQLLSINFYVLILDKLKYSNPLRSLNFDRNSLKLHRVLQYNNLSGNIVKIECFSHAVGQKSILKIVELAKCPFFSIESGSESGYSFIRPLKEIECYKNINFNEILFQTHCLVKF